MADKEIKIYRYPNPEIISVILPREVSTYRVEFFRPPLGLESEERRKSLGKIGEKMVAEIMELPGIMELHVKPKELRVKKEPFSAWEDIEDKLIKIIERALIKKEIHLVKS